MYHACIHKNFDEYGIYFVNVNYQTQAQIIKINKNYAYCLNSRKVDKYTLMHWYRKVYYNNNNIEINYIK